MEFTALQCWGVVAAVVPAVLLCENMAAATGDHGAPVRVMVYDHARIPAQVVEGAGAEAVRIFRASGIALEWVNCSGRGAVADCQVDPDSSVFVLHITHGPRNTTDSVYGEAFLAENGRGKYADVFFDRIATANRDCRVNVVRLLGAVAAHEIGHLLLGSHAHSWIGIMAPVWERESLRQVDMGHLLFNQEQGMRMRERVRDDRRMVLFGGKVAIKSPF
jgi:hypothetical protein